MVVYKITNLINGKIYVGKNINNTKQYFGSGKLIKQAILFHGKSNFKKEIIEYCESLEVLNIREQYWITKLCSNNREIGYNITIGGDGGDTFTMQCEDRKDQIRKKLSIKASNITQDSRKKHSNNTKNLWKKPEYRESVKLGQSNIFSSAEYKLKHSNIMKAIANSPENRKIRSDNSIGKNNSKWKGYAYLYNREGILVKRYDCLKYLLAEIKISSKNGLALLNGCTEITIGSAKRLKLKYEGFLIKISKRNNLT